MDEIPRDVFPLGLAPFIRLSTEGQEGGKQAPVAEDGEFGLNPGSWAKLEYGRKTYNARAETVHEKISYKNAWAVDSKRRVCHSKVRRRPSICRHHKSKVRRTSETHLRI